MAILRTFVAGTMVVLALVACGSESEPAATEVSAPAPSKGPQTDVQQPDIQQRGDQQPMVHGSRVKLYESIDDLAAESDLVLVGTVKGEDGGKLHGRAMRHVKVAVERTVRGSGPNEVTVVERAASPADAPPPLRVGQEYLLYLVDTTLDVHPEHHYYVTGVSGQFRVDGDQVRRLDPLATELPATTDLEPLLRVAATVEAQPHGR